MPIYVSMLRGINVGGNRRIKMDELRKSLEAVGFANVKIYIQSGNVVLKAAKSSPAAISRQMEDCISKRFGFPVSVISRTLDEIGKIIAGNPFLKQRGIDADKLHVAFLSEAPASAGLNKLAELTKAPDQSCGIGKDVYLYLPNGVSQSSLWKTPLDRFLSVNVTMRNWKTVNALHQMGMDCH
jgi:uncharacterized protein (DUF1697 family)